MNIIDWIKNIFAPKPDKLNIILFGPPGSGKGTQATKLVNKYNLLHISTGDLFRYEMDNNTPLGIKALEYMGKGNLVPDEITIGMLNNKVESNLDVKGYIFDGFPRNTTQAKSLNKLLADKGMSISKLVALEVEDKEIVSRILLRGETSGRADDQDSSIIQNRINIYNNETAIVFEHYNKNGKSIRVSGMGTIEEIFSRLCDSIDNV